MISKFGKLVDLEIVERVPADPQTEDVRCRMIAGCFENDHEMKIMEKRVRIAEHDQIISSR